MTLQVIHPDAESHDEREQLAERQRERALALMHAGLPLCSRELALLLRKGISQFHKLAKRGAYDDLRIVGTIGPAMYSGVKVERFLNGDVVDETPVRRSFGRARNR